MYVSKNQKLMLASNLNCTSKANRENQAEFYVCIVCKFEKNIKNSVYWHDLS